MPSAITSLTLDAEGQVSLGLQAQASALGVDVVTRGSHLVMYSTVDPKQKSLHICRSEAEAFGFLKGLDFGRRGIR